MTPARLRIVKVGGSLFDLPDLAQRMRTFLGDEIVACDILIAGGGALVEQVRQLHDKNPIDHTRAHWICVELMSITARLLTERLGLESVATDIDELPPLDAPSLQTFDASKWLRHVEPITNGTQLPIGWEVTSDSIAARLATTLGAEELVLLKSALPADTDIRQMAEDGYVDSAFPTFAAELPTIRFVNLRDASSLLVRRTQDQT